MSRKNNKQEDAVDTFSAQVAEALARAEQIVPVLRAMQKTIRALKEKPPIVAAPARIAESEPMLTQREVMRRTSLSRTTIYLAEREGRFPAKVQLSDHRIGWRAKDVQEWLEGQGPRQSQKKRGNPPDEPSARFDGQSI